MAEQTFNAHDVGLMVFLIAEIIENYPELLDGQDADIKAVAYKALAAAPKVGGGKRNVQIVVTVKPGLRGSL